jgi:hypothetical protein
MSISNLVLEPKVEDGGRSEVMLVRKDLGKAGGREWDISLATRAFAPKSPNCFPVSAFFSTEA